MLRTLLEVPGEGAWQRPRFTEEWWTVSPHPPLIWACLAHCQDTPASSKLQLLSLTTRVQVYPILAPGRANVRHSLRWHQVDLVFWSHSAFGPDATEAGFGPGTPEIFFWLVEPILPLKFSGRLRTWPCGWTSLLHCPESFIRQFCGPPFITNCILAEVSDLQALLSG